MTKSLLDTLNEQQVAAVNHVTGPALVVAGPGSGKTRVLTHRIAQLITKHHVSPINILCVTFTNKAAQEINDRVEVLLEAQTTKLPWSGTFHSICAKILRIDGFRNAVPRDYVIYDSDDQETVIKQCFKDLGINSKTTNPRAVLASISSAKCELVTPTEYATYAKGMFQKTVSAVYVAYQKKLKENVALDFDDLLLETIYLLKADKSTSQKYQAMFQYVLVDEYQDINKTQYVLLKTLLNQAKNLFVVGDMAQAIYSFRGADYRNILNFNKDYPEAKVYNLEQNYRSTQIILEAATNLINHNTSHIPLELWTQNSGTEKITVFTGTDEKAEAQFLVTKIVDQLASGKTYSTIAILYRTNAQTRNIEEHLIKNSIPYKIVGGFRFYARKEIKDIIAYLRVVYNPKDTVSWKRIINTPPRGIGQKSIEKLENQKWELGTIEEKTKLPITQLIAGKETLSTLELLDEVIAKSGYITWLDDGSVEAVSRIENIQELRSVAATFTDLKDFLENVALIESSNKPHLEQTDAVTLMTIHASKGLEFDTVFLVGMEEGLLPHTQSSIDLAALEEERRLCYVAITRAKKQVFLTRATKRLYFGRTEYNQASRFIKELPQNLLIITGDDLATAFDRSNPDFLDDVEYNRKLEEWF